MTSQTISLYSSAFAMIGVLVGFAKANRNSGWRRSRTSLGEALQNFYSDMEFSSSSHIPAMAQTQENYTDFSAQLLSLRAALGSSAPVTATVKSAEFSAKYLKLSL